MLAKVFKVDVTKCESCGGDMWPICSVLDRASLERYFKHAGIDHLPPARAPARPQPIELFESSAE